jgi:ribosomal protein S18 acetylase RimI-like enzyme
MTVQIRSFADKDLQKLVRLLNEVNKGSYEFTPYTEESLSSWIQEAKLKVLMAEEKGKISGSAAYNDGHWGEEIEWLVARENLDRKTIEDELVREIEKCVKGKTVFTAIDVGSPKINEWIERGYKLEDGLCHMVAGIDGLKPLPKVPKGTIVRSLKPNEEKEFVAAVNAGFGWERVKLGVIQRWKLEFPSFNEEWIHVAEIDNKIVSVVVAKPDTKYNKFFDAKRGYLGPASTLPEFRGKNLALALTRRAMNFLCEKGMDSVALYTSERNVPSLILLQKLDFKVGHHWKFMRKTFSNKG